VFAGVPPLPVLLLFPPQPAITRQTSPSNAVPQIATVVPLARAKREPRLYCFACQDRQGHQVGYGLVVSAMSAVAYVTNTVLHLKGLFSLED
jgi:hypothetical protein